jgi:hypothetical protein
MLGKYGESPTQKQGKNYYMKTYGFCVTAQQIVVPITCFYHQKQTAAFAYLNQVNSDHVLASSCWFISL